MVDFQTQKTTCAYGTVDDAQAQVIQVATAMGRDHAQSGWFGIPVAKLQFCDVSWCFYVLLSAVYSFTSSTAQGGGGSFRIGNL